MARGKFEAWRRPEGLTLLAGWARDGLTDEQISKNIGISRSTLSEWKLRFSDISDALKKSKEIADYEVENALHRRATGYEYLEEKVEIQGKRRTVTQTLKHISPDVGAAAFWLKNRRPDKWRDRTLDKTGSLTDGLTVDEINNGLINLADIINHPVPNRNIADLMPGFDDGSDDEQ
jgi:transcriptional regulator with XRE-family HTH domain